MKILERQWAHLVSLFVLIPAVILIGRLDGFNSGSVLGVSTGWWLALSVGVAIAHQLWVLLFWRLELYYRAVSGALGKAGFPLYAAGFGILFLARPMLLVALALANRGTLPISRSLSWLAVGVLSLPVLYVMYSVARYFGFRRALGADHFDDTYRQRGLERRGSFGLVRNSMYVLGLLFLWIPGLIWRSNAALLAAAFQHVYIWVHYFTVEQPDMQHIYEQDAIAGHRREASA